jgi:hypothetical protein
MPKSVLMLPNCTAPSDWSHPRLPVLAGSVAKLGSPTSHYEMWRSLILGSRRPFLRIAIFSTKLMGISFGAPPEHRLWQIPRKRFATKSALDQSDRGPLNWQLSWERETSAISGPIGFEVPDAWCSMMAVEASCVDASPVACVAPSLPDATRCTLSGAPLRRACRSRAR